jgi:hypothetical protein
VTAIPPIPPMPPSPPIQPAHDGATEFGVWLIPGPTDQQQLVLESDPAGEWIEASVDGRVLLTVPKPSASCPSASSAPCVVDGHELLVYAVTWDGGRSVRCDVFVDGYSLSTHRPISVIEQREAAARIATQGADRSSKFGRLGKGSLDSLVFVAVMSWGEMTVVAHESHSTLGFFLAGALVVGANLALVRPWRLAFRWLHKTDWRQPRVGIAACGMAVGFGISALPIALVALAVSRIG